MCQVTSERPEAHNTYVYDTRLAQNINYSAKYM